MKQKTIRGDTCTYNEYMHIAQALRTLIIEDRKSIRRFYDHVYQITNLKPLIFYRNR